MRSAPITMLGFNELRSGKSQEEILRYICENLHGGDWDKFVADLEGVLKNQAKGSGGPGSIIIRRRTIERDLAWIYAAREAGNL